jgi:excisionase family DNA binding protein
MDSSRFPAPPVGGSKPPRDGNGHYGSTSLSRPGGSDSNRPLLTQKEVAKRLGVSVSSVRRYTKAGLVPYVKLPSGPVRYRPEDVEEFIWRYRDGPGPGVDSIWPVHGSPRL